MLNKNNLISQNIPEAKAKNLPLDHMGIYIKEKTALTNLKSTRIIKSLFFINETTEVRKSLKKKSAYSKFDKKIG